MKTLMTIALAGTLLMASSALAQQDRRGDLREQEDHISDVIQRSVDEGQIGRREADRAFGELRDIRDREERLRDRHRGRLSRDDRDRIQDRLANLDREVDQMRAARRPEPPPPFDPGRELERLLNRR